MHRSASRAGWVLVRVISVVRWGPWGTACSTRQACFGGGTFASIVLTATFLTSSSPVTSVHPLSSAAAAPADHVSSALHLSSFPISPPPVCSDMRGTDVRAKCTVAKRRRTLCVIPHSALQTPVTSRKVHGRPSRASLNERHCGHPWRSRRAALTDLLTLSHRAQSSSHRQDHPAHAPCSPARPPPRSTFQL